MFFRAAAALMLVVAVGCQNSSAPAPQAASPQHAIVVTYPNGGGTTVFLPPPAGSTEPVVLCSAGMKVCPMCEAAAAKYFATGVLDPKCSITGGSRTVIDYTPPGGATN
jgi:hypothetical protein